MTLYDIWTTFSEFSFFGCGGLLILLTFIQIAPIKVNPWTAIARWLGRAMNGELFEKVDKIDAEIKEVKADMHEQEAINARIRILRFGDECLHNRKHTKEHFDQILLDISEYTVYCTNHPTFKNNVTELTSARIKEIYNERLRNNDFL